MRLMDRPPGAKPRKISRTLRDGEPLSLEIAGAGLSIEVRRKRRGGRQYRVTVRISGGK